MEKKVKRSGVDPLVVLTLICAKSDGIDFVVLALGTKSDLAYVLVFHCYLFRHFGRRTNCERKMVTSSL